MSKFERFKCNNCKEAFSEYDETDDGTAVCPECGSQAVTTNKDKKKSRRTESLKRKWSEEEECPEE